MCRVLQYCAGFLQYCAGVYNIVQGFTILCRGLQYCAGVYNIVQGFTTLCRYMVSMVKDYLTGCGIHRYGHVPHPF